MLGFRKSGHIRISLLLHWFTDMSNLVNFSSGDTCLVVFQLLVMESWVKGLKTFFVNLQGFCQGASDLCAFVQDCHPDFVWLVETHLDGTPIVIYLPPGYIVATHKDYTHHGSGVLLLCKDYLLVDFSNCVEFYP